MAALDYWQRCRWHLTQFGRYYWPWYLSALIAFVSAGIGLYGLSLSDDAVVVAVNVEQNSSIRHELPAQQAQTDLRQFYALLPGQAQSAPILQHVFQLAEKNHVSLAHGEYRVVSPANVSLANYEILLPVQAEPGDIQRFITSALQEIRPLTLKTIRFERTNQSDTQVKANVHFILWLKAS